MRVQRSLNHLKGKNVTSFGGKYDELRGNCIYAEEGGQQIVQYPTTLSTYYITSMTSINMDLVDGYNTEIAEIEVALVKGLNEWFQIRQNEEVAFVMVCVEAGIPDLAEDVVAATEAIKLTVYNTDAWVKAHEKLLILARTALAKMTAMRVMPQWMVHDAYKSSN